MAARKEPLWRRYLHFFGPDVGADVEDELRFHLEMRERSYLERGFSPEDARMAARRKFGDFDRHTRELTRQDGRQLRRDRWGERLGQGGQDFRFAVRMLWLRRGFSFSVIGTLALGIGATTAIFSAVDAAMLKPLPFLEPERLVELPEIQMPFAPNGTELPTSAPDIRTVGARRDLFSDITAYASGGLNLSGSGAPVRVQVGVVTSSFFGTLGIKPLLGRAFATAEGTPGADAVTVLSYRLWQRQFGGDSVLGKTLRLTGRPYQVIGVMPRGFGFPGEADLWIPLTIPMTFQSFAPFRGFVMTTVVARLAPGVSMARAAGPIGTMWRSARADYFTGLAGLIANPLQPLQTTLVGDRRTPMLILLGATGLLLLIACVNVTNLLLAHAAVRDRELAVRAVLGATRSRLIRQLLTQSLVLAMAGAIGGLGLAYSTLGLVSALLPRDLAGLAAPAIDVRVLAFTIGTAALTALGFGLWPALRGASTDVQTTMKSGGQSAGASKGRARRILVTAELAMALMLLAGAGLMLRSFRTLVGTDAGFRTEHVATLQVNFETGDAPNSGVMHRQRVIVDQLIQRLEGTSGIEAAGVITDLPLSGQGTISFRIQVEGQPYDSLGPQHFPRWIKASDGYFRTLNIRLLKGRLMSASDDSLAPKVAVISQSMAKEFWPGEDPIGKRFRDNTKDPWRTVVGMVADVRERLDTDPDPQAYYPITESPPLNLSLVARSTMPAAALMGAMRNAVREIDPNQAVYNVRMLDEMQSISLAPRLSNTMLITIFGLLALLLAVVGVYSVMAYGVTLRTRELGIRAALGADRSRLIALVLGEGMRVAVVGVSIGLVGTLALTRLLRSLLFGVGPTDPIAIVGASVVLVAPVLLATLVPARRAAGADPVEVMRSE